MPTPSQVSAFSLQLFSLTDELAATALSLPIGPHLSEEQARYVAQTLGSVLATLETRDD